LNIRPTGAVPAGSNRRSALQALGNQPTFPYPMKLLVVFGLLVGATMPGCLSVRTHSTVDPIHMTVDVNVNVRVQRELEDVFGDLDQASREIAEQAASN